MTYRECLEYLEQASKFGIKLGLDTIRTFLRALGSPQDSFPSVLVAGTNGKGSVCAMIQSALETHGFRTGLYTSPHLVKVEERIRIGQEPISPDIFSELMSLLRDRIESLKAHGKLPSPPTYFELLTCLAFLYFAREEVDLAVLEVGMGGRLDATNVVTPLVSVITTVALDHQEHLGPTLEQIAQEKAGIIKPGIPVICGLLKPPARRVIEVKARKTGAPLVKVFARGKWQTRREGANPSFIFRHNGEKYIFQPALPGEHQGRNGAVAIAALLEISRSWHPLEKDKIIQGIEKVSWEGRLEKIAEKPVVFLDGAHNEEGARALRRFWLGHCRPPLILVFAILRDKKIRRVARHLFPLAELVILTSISSSRAAKPEEVLAATSGLNHAILVEPDPWKALELGRKKAGPHGTVLVTGSLYLVGEIKKRIQESAPVKK